MRYFLLCIVGFLVPYSVWGQPTSSFDIGGGVGVSSYYGDINQNNFFYNPQLGMSGFIRFNLNRRYSVRINFLSTSIKANDSDFENDYQQNRKVAIDIGIMEFGVVGEFNFFPYVNPVEWQTAESTLYGVLGAGSGIRFGSEEEQISMPVLIMGVGYKKPLGHRFALEIEWAFRKCLEDTLDGIKDPIKSEETSRWFNNDWYNIFEAKLTFNLWQQGGKCRTFESDAEKSDFCHVRWGIVRG